MGGGWYKAGSGPAGKHLLHGAMRCCFQSCPGSSTHCLTQGAAPATWIQPCLSFCMKGIYCKPAPPSPVGCVEGERCLQLPAAEEPLLSSWAGNRDLQQQRGWFLPVGILPSQKSTENIPSTATGTWLEHMAYNRVTHIPGDCLCRGFCDWTSVPALSAPWIPNPQQAEVTESQHYSSSPANREPAAPTASLLI